MKKGILFFNISIVFIFVLAGCGSKRKNGIADSVDIGVILPEKKEYDWKQTISVMEKCSSLSGNKLEVKYTGSERNNEESNIQSFISKGVKVLIICSDDSKKTSAILEKCKELKEKDITVISYKNLIRDTNRVQYFVSYDSIVVGNAQGAYLVNNVKGKGNSLYLFAGDANKEEDVKLFEGAWKALWPKIDDGTFLIKNSKNAVRLKKKSVLTNYELKEIMKEIRAKEFSKNEEFLKDCGEDKYILAPYDRDAREICDYFANNNYKSKYYITGNGTEKNSVQYILNNKQSMSVYEKESVIAEDAMRIANNVMFAKDVDYDILCYNGVVDVKMKQSQPVTIVKTNLEKELEK